MNQPALTSPSPETPSAKEIGAQMARLREQFGLSQQEVSERLHIRARYVGAIEEGRYDQMPGIVYARGYVQTYAEFLGLNPDEIVPQFFAGELPSNKQPIPAIAAARYTTPMARDGIVASSSQWRGYAVMGAVVLVLLLVVSQFTGGDGEPEKQEAVVAQVPEDMLETVRTLVMPQPNNFVCLTTDDVFECLNADATTRMLGRLNEDSFHYGGAINVSSLALAPAAKEEHVTEEENPDSPPVATEPNETPLSDTDSDTDEGSNRTPPHD